MRPVIYYLIFLSFIVQSCSDGNKHASDGSVKGDSVVNDTARINKILQQVSGKNVKNADSTLKYLKLAEELSAKNNFEKGSANAFFLHGNFLYNENKYNEALSYYSKALSLAEKLNLPILQANCLERMASVHLATDDTHLALKLYYESLAICEKNNYEDGIARGYNILGIYKSDCGEYDSAEVYLTKSLEINKKIKNEHGIINNKGNLGRLYERQGFLEKAEKIYLEIVSSLVKIQDTQALPVSYYNLSSVYQSKEDLPTALKFIKLAIYYSEKTHDTSLLSTLYGNTGEMFLKTGKHDSANFYLHKSVICSREIDDDETESQALSLLADIDSASGNFQAAYMTMQRISLLKDTICQRKLRNNLKESQWKYENNKKQHLINLQQMTLLSNGKERRLYNILLIISFIAGIFSIIIIILGKRQYHKNLKLHVQEIEINNLEVDRLLYNEEINKLRMERIEEDVKIKERELVSIALRIDQKNELLDFVSKKVKEFSGNDPGLNPDKVLQDIDSSIKLQLNEAEGSDLFNERFSTIHQHFFTNLRKRHPDLSKTELKFCAYLRVHLSTNQIATILNVTNEAIRKSRYRIRKKMNLTREDSLEEYLQGF